MNFYLQEARPAAPPPFDPDVVWEVFRQLGARFLAHLPYLVLGLVVFLVFLVAGRVLKRFLVAAGRALREAWDRAGFRQLAEGLGDDEWQLRLVVWSQVTRRRRRQHQPVGELAVAALLRAFTSQTFWIW